MHVKLTSSKRLFDIWQETSYRRLADEQTLLKIRLPDVNWRSISLVLSGWPLIYLFFPLMSCAWLQLWSYIAWKNFTTNITFGM